MTDITKFPPLHGKIYGDGYDGRFRLWTVNEVPFDFFPRYEDGGPSSTPRAEWSKSVTTSYDSPACNAQIGKPKLNVYRFVNDTRISHTLDGTEWETKQDADRAAYEAGVTAFMVYVKNEAKYGIVNPSLA